MARPPFVAALCALTTLLTLTADPSPARACGGFFCGQVPVDQQAERIIFAVGESTTTMVVQIAFQGKAEDFAWVLPLSEVPTEGSLDVFPRRALVALDVNTSPVFWRPEDGECGGFELNGGGPPESTPGVTVHIEEVVGPYAVSVIESEDPGMLVAWLRDNDYRITEAMVPLLATYTEAGMKMLALKLAPGRDTSDIEPFRLELPGTAPTIPLRLTAIAAEPEMGILVFVLGDMRYGPANWPEIEIDDSELVWSSHAYPAETNWAALVARKVDEAGGQGFVTEMASPTEPYRAAVEASPVRDEDDEAARAALLELLSAHRYVTRLYTRLSGDEMTSDPVFRRHAGPDVPRDRFMPRYDLDGRDLCGWGEVTTTACDFVTCGRDAGCASVETSSGIDIAACACPPGATARTTLSPSGMAVVICQDARLSFLEPGMRETPDAIPLPDPCVGFDCGVGECDAVNMTPTCRCDAGAVAIGWMEDGARRTRCVDPDERLAVDPRFPPRDPPRDPPMDPPRDPPMDPPRDPPMDPPAFTPAGGGCAASGAGGPSVALALALVVLLRRRR